MVKLGEELRNEISRVLPVNDHEVSFMRKGSDLRMTAARNFQI